MYGAFNGDEDGADIPALGVRTESQFPTGPDTGFGTFQPFAIVSATIIAGIRVALFQECQQ